MRNEYLDGNQTTWNNTDTRIKPSTFYEQDLHQRFAIRELGGREEFNDYINHLPNVEELKHEKGTNESIMELKSLIQRHRINSNSANKIGTTGSLADRITKLSIYGEEKKSETDLKIDKIKKTMIDFTKQRKEQKQNKTKQYKTKEMKFKNKSRY